MMASMADRDLGIDRPRRRRRLFHAPLQFGNGAGRPLRTAAANEHVVEDQADGVDVGALIDGCPLACSGAMYSMVPITRLPPCSLGQRGAVESTGGDIACGRSVLALSRPDERAIPKSMIGRFAILPTMMFAGLRSR